MEYIFIAWEHANFCLRTILIPKAEFVTARPNDYAALVGSVDDDGKIHQKFAKTNHRFVWDSINHPFSEFIGWLEMVDGDEAYINSNDAPWFYKSWWGIDVGYDDNDEYTTQDYLERVSKLEHYKGVDIRVVDSFLVVEDKADMEREVMSAPFANSDE